MTPKRVYFILLAVLILTVAGSAGAYYYADRLLAQRATEISRLKAEHDIVELKISNARDAEKKIEELAFVAEIAEQVLPPEKLQSNVLGELVKFASDTGVNLQSVAFSPTDAKATSNIANSQTVPLEGVPGVSTLKTTITISRARYDQALSFLEKLESNRRKMQVDSINLSPTDDTFSASIVLDIYVKN